MKRLTCLFAMLSILAVATMACGEIQIVTSPTPFTPLAGGPETVPGNLYDNFPTALGGTATEPGTAGFRFTRWANRTIGGQAFGPAAWGDDLHDISEGGPGTAVVQSIDYYFVNSELGPAGTQIMSNRHKVQLYSMVPASATHGVCPVTTTGTGTMTNTFPILPCTGTQQQGSLLFSAIVSPVGFGQLLVNVPVNSVSIPGGAAWFKVTDVNNRVGTFWLTGGIPGVGSSHDGVTYTDTTYTYANYWINAPLGGRQSNTTVALSGFHIPEPSSIALIGLAGALVLGWRRRL